MGGRSELKELVELDTDHLMAVNRQTTATGLATILDNKIKPNKFTQMLANGTGAKYLSAMSELKKLCWA